MASADSDPVIKQFREQISDNDLKIVEAINKRIKLVAQLKTYKEQQGIGFLDPERDQWMITFVSRANRGPLSVEGLHEIFEHVLELSRREVVAREAKAGETAPRAPS
jgi:chorismate mutase/prephenate dehydratase